MLNNYIVPLIELLASGDIGFMNAELTRQVYERRKIARCVVDYFKVVQNGEKMSSEAKIRYYHAVTILLRDPDYKRILLYLPLSDLKGAPNFFKDAYLDAWYSLLRVQDVRENFYEGDSFEVDARPEGKMERIVKCVHLVPWLIEAEYLNYRDLVNILDANLDNEVLMRSFANTLSFISDRRLLSTHEIEHLRDMTAMASQRKWVAPLFISEKRRKWLETRESQPTEQTLLTPKATLAGPFSANLPTLARDFEKVQSELKPQDIVLVGGSRLKGYGVFDSDLDVFSLKGLENNKEMRAGSPHAAHLYFNSIWIGGDGVMELLEVAIGKAEAYYGAPDRRRSIERLESDLLQYRLLHKGYQRFMRGRNSLAEGYSDLDGDCPFYDEGYRKIATELFVKYVFIPKSIKTARD
jgi:hypothetical protein